MYGYKIEIGLLGDKCCEHKASDRISRVPFTIITMALQISLINGCSWDFLLVGLGIELLND